MNLYTHTMATNLAVTSVYSKTNKVMEPKHSGGSRRDKKHKDGVEVSVSKFKLNGKEKELLKTLQSMYG
jgi:hypothetical protein